MKKEITSLQHPLVKHIVKLRQDRQYRHAQQSFIMEGIKPILEIPKGWIKNLVYLPSLSPLAVEAEEEWIINEPILKKISGMVSSEGIIAEVRMPSWAALNTCQHVLALDGINDPGNMGTILRTALALGWQGAFILPTCCDPFNEKAIRAARGAHFKFPLAFGKTEDLKAQAAKNGWTCVVADLDGQPPEQMAPLPKCLLVLGNEAHGASPEVLDFCSKVTIPMPGSMESLNVAVAGGILMYAFRPLSRL